MDSATETEGEGGTEKGREGRGRGICCHGERFFKQLLIRLCCSAPLSILLLSLSLPSVLPPAVQARDLYTTRSAVDFPASDLLRGPPHAGMGDPFFQTQREGTSR